MSAVLSGKRNDRGSFRNVFNGFSESEISATGLLLLLTIVAGSFFLPVFESWSFLVPPLLGAVFLAFAAAVVSDRFRISNGESVLVQGGLAVLTLPGLLKLKEASFGLPLPAALTALLRALIDGPARLLTTPTPAQSGESLLVAPVTSAWVGFVLGWLLLRSAKPSWAVVGPTLTLVCALAFGPNQGSFLGVISAVFLFTSLFYLRVVGSRNGADGRRVALVAGSSRSFRLTTLFVLLLAVGFAASVGNAVTSIGRSKRFTLREYRTPPFDPTDLPSPLAEYGKYLKPAAAKSILFRVEGANLPTRWRLATLTTYDGRVWSVGKPSDGGGTFDLVGARLTDSDSLTNWGPAKTKVTIEGLREPFLPLPGPALSVTMTGDAVIRRNDLRYNSLSDTMVLPSGVTRGDTYEVSWARQEMKPITELGGRGLGAPAQAGDLPSGPSASKIGAKAAEWSGGLPGVDGVVRVKAALDQGVLSPSAAPGHAFGDLAKLVSTPNSLVGTGEHFAALLGVLTRANGVASRVVVGFVPSDSARQVVRGQDIRAWVEVEVAGVGWVPIDLVQDPSKKPKIEKSQPKPVPEKNMSAPNTLPDAQPDDQTLEPSKQSSDKAKSKSKGLRMSAFVSVVLLAVGVPVLFTGLNAGLISFVKRRRYRKRRSGSSSAVVAGAWEEVLERARESGFSVRPELTVTENAGVLIGELPGNEAELLKLASAAESAAFHSVAAEAAAGQEAWTTADVICRAMKSGSSSAARFRRLVNPLPLFQGSASDAFAR